MGKKAGRGGGARYAAFISYSHKDAAFVTGLHRWLETYRIPKRLVGRETAFGVVPARLAPIFHDRQELPAGEHLPERIEQALAASAGLLVICSPDAAQSAWVGQEIRKFRSAHPAREDDGGLRPTAPIVAALVAGEPSEAFHAELTEDGRKEPIAADFRKGADGTRLARLKLIAGLTGVGLAELAQRDALRQRDAVIAITAASLVAVLAMGTLTTFAVTARQEAERQRHDAEALVEFMLTDLRDKLEGVGSLDVMTGVNRKALAYYAGQDLAHLPPASLDRRARVLQAMGKDDADRHHYDRALAEFQEARRTTEALLAARPSDPERIFGEAQSRYWAAYVDYKRGRSAAAKAGFETYRALAERLIAIAPDDVRYRRELAFGEGNICTAALEEPTDLAAALTHCSAALTAMESVAARRPGDAKTQADLANRHAWLADAYRAAGDLRQALAHRQAEGRILDALMTADPQNLKLRAAWVGQQRATAGLEGLTGATAAAMVRLRRARATLDPMIARDGENAEWRALRERIDASMAYFEKSPAVSTARGG